MTAHEDHVAEGVAGILLTGGASTRMGFDKASLVVEGESLAVRVGRVLSRVARPVVEVGRGISGLRAVVEGVPGSGPLVAVAEGCRELQREGHCGPALVLACDLPFVNEEILSFLANWPGVSSVVPLVAGVPQPLCARWSRPHLDSIAAKVAEGERAMRSLLNDVHIVFVDEAQWARVASRRAFTDIDRREDLDRLGLRWSTPAAGE